MKKILAFTLVGLSELVFANGIARTPLEKSMLLNLKANYPNTVFHSVRSTPIKGVFEVQMGQNLAYVGEDARFFIFGGHVFDMREQRDMTADRLTQLGINTTTTANDVGRTPSNRQQINETRVQTDNLPSDLAFTRSRGTGSRKVYIFADPLCGYCKQLDEELSKLNDLTIYTFVLPILGAESENLAKQIACVSDKPTAWANALRDRTLPTSTNCSYSSARIREVAEKLGIRGTPVIISEDGRQIAGAVDAAYLDKWLNQSSSNKTLSPKK